MINLVQLCLTIVANLGILAVIGILSYKKIVPYLMKKTLAGYMSGFNRNQKAAKREIVKIMMDKTLIAPILDQLGFSDLKKYALQHPDSALTIAELAAPYVLPLVEAFKQGAESPTNPEMKDITPIEEKVKRLMAKYVS